MKQKNYNVAHLRCLGLMSGTSLDGLDLALINWTLEKDLSYQIEIAETIPYNENCLDRLHYNPKHRADDLLKLNHDFGIYLGDLVNQFLAKNRVQASSLDFIASHGHTYFHRPLEGYSYQLGGGPELSLRTGIPSITDFRSADLARGGQGAPLAPILDRDIFPSYQACLNLGGIANVSLQDQKPILAYDIAAANQVLNHLAQRRGLPYDQNGELAQQGKVLPELLDRLNKLDFYRQAVPKSLGIEWTHREIFPLLREKTGSPEDLSRTYVEHLAQQICLQLPPNPRARILVTGGGAFHQFLIRRLQKIYSGQICLPDAQIINFKEALLIAYLGLLRWKGRSNVLASVTGADRDHCSGTIFSP